MVTDCYKKLQISTTRGIQYNTMDENIIGAPKMRNKFWCLIKYWTFPYCFQFSYRSSIFSIAKVVTLNLYALFFCVGFVHKIYKLKGEREKKNLGYRL